MFKNLNESDEKVAFSMSHQQYHVSVQYQNEPKLQNFIYIFGCIDVGYGCWRPNELVTSLKCW